MTVGVTSPCVAVGSALINPRPGSKIGAVKDTLDPLGWPIACILGAVLALGCYQSSFLQIEDQFAGSADDMAGIAEIRDTILDRWVEPPKEGQLRDGALQGMVNTLDPFSDFISAEQLSAFEEQTTGKFGGLGIWINVKDGLVVVISPIEDTPAWEAGILPGDTVLKVDGKDCEFANANAAVRALKGEPGTTVELTILHQGTSEPVVIAVERAVIQIRSVKGARLLDATSKIGYLRLTTFSSGTVQEFRDEVVQLNEQGMRALVLDLRNNPGGFLDAATKIAGLFLPESSVLVRTKGRDASDVRESKATAEQLVRVPTAVLINQGSASASEILGGALQDHGVATLIGTRSYGKGSVQSIISVLGGSAELKLTTQYYFTPKGRRIHRGEKPADDDSWGLVPDVPAEIDLRLRWEIAQRESDRELERLKAKASGLDTVIEEQLHRDDPQVKAAYAHLLNQLGDPVPAEFMPSVDSPSRGDVATGGADGTPPSDEAPPAAPTTPSPSPAASPGDG